MVTVVDSSGAGKATTPIPGVGIPDHRPITDTDLAKVNKAPGQAVKACPACTQALVDTGDGQWNHAIGVEPCGNSPGRPREGG